MAESQQRSDRARPRHRSAHARLVAWAVDLVAAGLCRPLPGGRYELLCSQADLARRLGLSPTSGGVSKRLSTLEHLGVLVCRDPVVFDLSGEYPGPPDGDRPGRWRSSSDDTPAAHPSPAAQTTPPAPSPGSPPTPDPRAVVLTLLDRVLATRRDDLLPVTLGCAAILLSGTGTGTALDGSGAVRPSSSLPLSASSLPASSLPASSLPASSLPASSLAEVLPLSALPAGTPAGCPSSGDALFPFVLPPVVPAPRASRFPRPPGSLDRPVRAERVRRTAETAARLEALSPLLEDCRRRGLPGVSSPSGLLDAFAGCTLEEIERGVAFVRSQLATHAALRSPVGLLAHLARNGDLALLGDLPAPTHPDASPALRPGLEPRPPADEPPTEWLSRMASLMRDLDGPAGV